MLIDWNDNNKRKAFRCALQEVYPNEADLKLFVDEEMNENLAVIAANNNLQTTAHSLIVWAKGKGKLDEVFEAFRRENPTHSIIAELQQQPFVKRSSNLLESDWETLFSFSSSNNFAYLQIAFRYAFKVVYGQSFEKIRPDHPPLNDFTLVQELLITYDDPTLAVRFVEFAIAELQRSNEGNSRDLTILIQWRDRIAQQYNVSPLDPEPDQTIVRQGYLLVSFEESGSDVIVYPELHVTGEEKPVEFGVSPVRCAFKDVPNHLSDWIYRAEEGEHVTFA